MAQIVLEASKTFWKVFLSVNLEGLGNLLYDRKNEFKKSFLFGIPMHKFRRELFKYFTFYPQPPSFYTKKVNLGVLLELEV